MNAAPSDEAVNGDGGEASVRPDLMDALKEKLGPLAPSSRIADGASEADTAKRQKLEKPKDDYDKFMEEIGGMLGPSISS